MHALDQFAYPVDQENEKSVFDASPTKRRPRESADNAGDGWGVTRMIADA
jgi:hypothetical protein